MTLTVEQAYLTMFWFLDKFWKWANVNYDPRKMDELAVFLGSMSPITFKDAISADPAYLSDWKKCVDELKIADKQNLTVEEAYQAMLDFVEFYFSRFFRDLDIVFAELIEVKSQTKGNHLTWGDWLECASAVSKK